MSDELDSFIARALDRASDRPTYPQTHFAMQTARNIVNQILDEAGTDIDTRQRINDDCDQFVAWMVEQHNAKKAEAISERLLSLRDNAWSPTTAGAFEQAATIIRSEFGVKP